MSSVLSFAPVKHVALIALATFVLLMSFALMPGQAHAASLSVTAATTTSNNVASSTLAKSGNTFHFGLQLNGTPVSTSTPVINIQGMGTSTMTGTGAFWEYSTTTSASWSSGAVSFLFAYGDSTPGAGATTTKSQANLTGSNVTFDKSAPSVSVSSDATGSGVLKVGDTITFTVTATTTEFGASVLGQYNGHTLSFSSGNGGVSYAGTYTVTEGDTDRATALQLAASMTDAAGNLSATTTGSDVVKTIDANSPSTVVASPVAGSFSSEQSITFTSSGSNSIRYTDTGVTPSCSTGTLYSSAVILNSATTLTAVGCDTAGNNSTIASFVYDIRLPSSHHGSGGGGGGGSSHSYAPTPSNASPAAPALANASAHAAFNRDLQVGLSGDDVKSLQAWLNAHGFTVALSGPGSAGMETLTFGALTKAAVAKFQAAHGIPAIGRMGPMTRAAIAATQ